MRLWTTIFTMVLASLLLAVPAAVWSDENDLRPAGLTLAADRSDSPGGAVSLVNGGHRGHGHDRFVHGGNRHDFDRHFSGHRHHRHFRSDLHRHHFRHFDGRFGHFGRPHLHHGSGVSVCFRDAGVLVCFSDRSFGHRSHW